MNKRISLNGSNWLFKDFYGEDWRGSHLPRDFAVGIWNARGSDGPCFGRYWSEPACSGGW